MAIAFLLVALAAFAVPGSRRFWFDEIYTAAVALQPTWQEAWKAYTSAVDLQSPLFYVTTRISWELFGRTELAARLPEILGMLIFCWCMFRFVGQRLGPLMGLCAMILPLVTNVELCASQARPYGMLVGACGLAMLAWRKAVESPRSGKSLALFAGSLALIVACHGYALVAVLMFGLAELFRAVRARRIDWPVWLCFLAAIPAAVPYWYIQRTVLQGHGVMGPLKWCHWSDIAGFYQFFFRARENVLIVFGMLLAGLAWLRSGSKAKIPGVPAHEVFLAAVLAAAPVFGVGLAMFTTRYYMARYTIFAMSGVIILGIILFDKVAPDRRVASVLLLFSSLLLFGMNFREYSLDGMRQRDAALEVPFDKVPPGMPLVVANGLALLPTDRYGSDAELANTYYLLDREADIHYTGSTVFHFDPPFTDYHHFRVHLVDYDAFTKAHKRFMVYGNFLWEDDWQLQKLRDDGARLVEKGRYEGEVVANALYEVTMP
ncbi:MAG TPA: glycosyltransferase family 39 protein [Bryobacteraceae bacterium]|jgi:hypothetical protein